MNVSVSVSVSVRVRVRVFYELSIQMCWLLIGR